MWIGIVAGRECRSYKRGYGVVFQVYNRSVRKWIEFGEFNASRKKKK